MIKLDETYLNSRVYSYVLAALQNFKEGRPVDTRSLFEGEFRKMTGTKHCFACHSGTAGIYISLLSIHAGKGDEVITNPLTDTGAISAIINCGAKPVFPKIDEMGFMDPGDLFKKINSRTKAVMPVHLGGVAENIKALSRIKNTYKRIYVIEDACQAVGSKVKVRGDLKCLGSLFDIGVFSFGAFKLLTTLEGGMVITGDDLIAERLGKLLGKGDYAQANSAVAGYALKLDHLRSAIGLANLQDLKEQIAARRAKWLFYKLALRKFSWAKIICPPRDLYMNYSRALIRISDKEKCRKLAGLLAKAGYRIEDAVKPFANEYLKSLFCRQDILERCRRLKDHFMPLPTHPGLKVEDIKMIVEAFEHV